MNPYTQRRHDLIEEGFCVACGCKEALEGRRMCEGYREVHRATTLSRGLLRSANGTCKIHGNPVVPGKKSRSTCQKNWLARKQKRK